MKSTKVASRYAKALMEIAKEQNKVSSVLKDMKFILQINTSTNDFESLISSPIISAEKKIQTFEKVFDQFEDVSKSFVKLITDNRRESILPAIAQSFILQVKDYEGITPITITSAVPLEKSVRDVIVTKIQKSVKHKLEIKEQVDESLIGGFVVKMGDMEIDASISNQFNNLKKRLVR